MPSSAAHRLSPPASPAAIATDAMGARHRAWWLLGALASLAVVALLGAIHLPFPFHGDKALYQLGARVLTEGGVLYVDFWDLKKPGIYLFHAIAGRLFGFSEVGLHAFELLYLLLLSAILIFAVRRHLEHGALALAAPLTTIGAYYCAITGWHLTQPAIIASLPLFLTIWPAVAEWRHRRSRALAFLCSGAAGAVAVLLKSEMLPIAVGSWLVAGAIGVAEGERPMHAFATRVGPALAGMALAVGLVALWFALHGALDEFVWVTVRQPLAAWAASTPDVPSRLLESAHWFAVSFGPPLVLTALIPRTWRGVARERLTLEMLLWLVTGGVAILLEPNAWWPFDFLILVVPVGLLAVRGADALLTVLDRRGWPPGRRRLTMAAVLLALYAPALANWATKAAPLLAARRRDGPHWMERYQGRLDPHYEQVRGRMGFLRAPGARPGATYVLGNPLYQLYSGRPQAIATNGWAWEVLPDARLRELVAQLVAAAPAYVFVDASYEELLRRRTPALLGWLARAYAPVDAGDDGGTWWVRR